MKRNDLSEGFDIGPIDDRDEEHPDYTVDPVLSSTNTNFGGEDPATEGPDPMPEMAPAWDYVDDEDEEHLKA